MKEFFLIFLLSLAPIPFARGQAHTQSISFDDGNGPGNAGVDLYLTFDGYNSPGLSLWLETTADAAPFYFPYQFY